MEISPCKIDSIPITAKRTLLGKTFSALVSTIFALIFLFLAILMVLAYFNNLKAMLGDYLIFSSLTVLGIRWLIRDIKYYYKKSLLKNNKEYKHKPWLIDYHWQEQGASYTGFSDIVSFLVPSLVIITVSVSIYELARDYNWGIIGYLIAFGVLAIVLYFLWRTVEILKHYNDYGKTTIYYGNFPFYLGEELKITVEIEKWLDCLSSLDCSLSCYREHWELQQTSDSTTKTLVVSRLYNIERQVRLDSFDKDEKKFSITFPIEDTLTSNSLVKIHPVYWELEIKSTTGNYNSRFLLPIYRGE